MNKYHISLHLQFKKDCDVNKIEKFLGIESYRKNLLKDSVGENKTAKLWFKTIDYTNPDTYKVLCGFIKELSPKLSLVKEMINEFDGKATLTLYFEEFHDKPYIKLDYEEMNILSQNKIDFDVDFRF